MFNPDKYRSVTWLKGGRYTRNSTVWHCERDTPRPGLPSGLILPGSRKTTAASTGKRVK
jgi:hypothetical protein